MVLLASVNGVLVMDSWDITMSGLLHSNEWVVTFKWLLQLNGLLHSNGITNE